MLQVIIYEILRCYRVDSKSSNINKTMRLVSVALASLNREGNGLKTNGPLAHNRTTKYEGVGRP